MLLNVLATEIQSVVYGNSLSPEDIFSAVSSLHSRVEGSYAALALISGFGLLAFRDPYGIRPLVLGQRVLDNGKKEWIVASESLVLENNDFEVFRDVLPGEAIFISNEGEFFSHQCSENNHLFPCAFEYVYLARPDSVMNGISVYEARLRMGDYLANTVKSQIHSGEVDVVMPIPDSSRPSAMQVARQLGVEYREGFFKNRYVGRTFIMPGQAQRKKSVRQKLNAMSSEFKDKNVLLVDDSIVRGTTSREIVQMAKLAGANKVFFTSAAPPIRFPHVYGINMPSKKELIAFDKSVNEIEDILSVDKLVYQEIGDLERAILKNSNVNHLDMSCFNGKYITGNITNEYLDWVESNYSS